MDGDDDDDDDDNNAIMQQSANSFLLPLCASFITGIASSFMVYSEVKCKTK